jgi:hypothetical protein
MIDTALRIAKNLGIDGHRDAVGRARCERLSLQVRALASSIDYLAECHADPGCTPDALEAARVRVSVEIADAFVVLLQERA